MVKALAVILDENLKEPADHLAVELDFLGNMIIRSNELEQEKHILQAI